MGTEAILADGFFVTPHLCRVIGLLLYLACFVCLAMVCTGMLARSPKPHLANLPAPLPGISILVAARNEERHIENCLKGLTRLDYPAEKIEILVGDDASTDHTARLVETMAIQHPHITLVNIPPATGLTKGKAHVLACLAEKSSGSYLLVTDADIAVKPCWAKAMLSLFNENTGIVSGVTVVQGNSLWASWQGIDWLYFSGVMQGFTNMGLPCTAVGNNMAVSRNAYQATGGYEHIPFSVVEDLALYKAVRKAGFESKNAFAPAVLNESAAQPTLVSLLHQRKRWLRGARQLPLGWQLILLCFALANLALLVLMLLSPAFAMAALATMCAVQWVGIARASQLLKLPVPRLAFITFPFYTIVVSLLVAGFLPLPGGVRWKNRTFL